MVDIENNWVGKRIADRFDIIKPISNGGMGVIFLAFDQNLQKKVVVKIPLVKNIDHKSEITARFNREIHCLTNLEHAFIVPIIFTGFHEDLPFIVTRYINNGNLRDRINDGIVKHQLPPIDSLLDWLPKIGSALIFMHQNNWIHRDIKPDNFLFDSCSICYLTDFGISKHLDLDPTNCLTSNNSLLGSPMYMAPEQHLGGNISAKADQFSLAVVIYEYLTNRLPFHGRTQSGVLLDIIRQNAVPLKSRVFDKSMPTSTSDAIMKALNFDPELRHDSVEIFLQELFQDLRIKIEFNGFVKKFIPSTYLHTHNGNLNIEKIQRKITTDKMEVSGFSRMLQDELQKMHDQMIVDKANFNPETLTNILKLFAEGEMFNKSKAREIINTLHSLIHVDMHKTIPGSV
jgi:serine/threonine protein kinase